MFLVPVFLFGEGMPPVLFYVVTILLGIALLRRHHAVDA